jgi:hypothetical protein
MISTIAHSIKVNKVSTKRMNDRFWQMHFSLSLSLLPLPNSHDFSFSSFLLSASLSELFIVFFSLTTSLPPSCFRWFSLSFFLQLKKSGHSGGKGEREVEDN